MRAEASETDPGQRRRQRGGGGKGEEAAETQATAGATAVSMSWLDGAGGGRREAAAAASGESGVRRKENQDREAPGAVPQADLTGPYKYPQIVRDFSRLLDKHGITIFVRRSAHEYTLNAFFTPYLNWIKVPFIGFSISLPHRSTYIIHKMDICST